MPIFLKHLISEDKHRPSAAEAKTTAEGIDRWTFAEHNDGLQIHSIDHLLQGQVPNSQPLDKHKGDTNKQNLSINPH